MAKAKKSTNPRITIPKILIYDDENIQYFVGNCGNLDIISGEPIEYCSVESSIRQYLPPMFNYFKCSISNFEQLDNITLDDTTMKRIAKFNKEVDIKKLDEQIEARKKQIDKLDSILQDREGRVEKLKSFIKNIYEINLNKYGNNDEDYDWDD